MDVQQKGLLTLIKSAITGERYPLPEGFDLLEAFADIQKHQISAIVYYGAVNCGYDPDEACMQQLFDDCYKQLVRSEKQLREIDRVLRAFEERGIDALPLKGTVLKKIYPKPEMRRMGDADILIQEKQYPRIKNILEELGFVFLKESNYEIVWRTPSLHLELHKKLFSEWYMQFDVYFKNGWNLAVPLQSRNHIYSMSPENTLFLMFVHFAKHYARYGIGLVHMIDLWVYNRAYPNLDQGYITGELEKLGLDKFYANTMCALQTWFADRAEDAVTDVITQRVFLSGVYGTHANRVLSDTAKTTRNGINRRTELIRRTAATLFPSRKTLQIYGYPILKKWPVLLPFVWVARWLRLIFVHRDRVRIKIQDFRNTSVKNVDAFERSLEFVGIRFPDKE